MSEVQKFKGKLVERFVLNEKIYYFHIELLSPYRIDFKAGQYVSIEAGKNIRRSYSIASSPDMDHAIDICIDISPGGIGSIFFKNLKLGDNVEFIGPLGEFFVKEESLKKEKQLVFVATGVGIVPLKSMIIDLLEKKEEEKKISLYWGLRFIEDVFWEEDFRRLNDVFNNFNFNLILSKPPLLWPLESGHVTDYILEENVLNEHTGIYICGNPKMIRDVSKIAEKNKVPKEQIYFERFY